MALTFLISQLIAFKNKNFEPPHFVFQLSGYRKKKQGNSLP
jgi:hypothetical protein